MRRRLYEGLLGIVSSNDALDVELFGQKRRHRERFPLYDKVAKCFPFDYIDQNGEVFEKKLIAKSLKKFFLQCKRYFYNAKKFYIKPPTFF